MTPGELPSVQKLYEVTELTWPAAQVWQENGFTLRRGDGGGQRVAATTLAGAEVGDLDWAEAQMEAMRQPRLFMIRQDEAALDAALEARGYRVHDPVNLYACPIETLCDKPIPRVAMFDIWEPLQIQYEIWAKGGIGPGRWAVMDRATGPKTSILARWDDHPAGTAFVAIHDGVAMIHAVEVLPQQRRKGVGHWIMRSAAIWARGAGAHTFSLVTTQANVASNTLYASLGMTLVGQYHYRIKKDP